MIIGSGYSLSFQYCQNTYCAKLEYKGMNLVTIKELKTPLFEELKV
jgi:hypothetical protein